MKSYMKVSLAALAIGAGVWIGSVYNNTATGAGTIQPGTADDPVVTKSYVDQQIQKALGGGISTGTGNAGNSGNAENSASTGNNASSSANAGSAGSSTELPPLASGASEALEIVTVKPGQQLIGSTGTEFIVRSGKAVIISEGTNGVADLTDGVDLINGQAVPMNHLLTIPKEGRGIQVVEGNKYSLTVMVRGGYTLK